jgi:hypothetical protein
MATTLTVAEIRGLVSGLTDIEIGAQERFTAATVNLMISESYAQYWMLLTDSGHPQHVTRTSLTTSASTASSNGWPANEFVALPSGFMALLSARIEQSSGSHVRMTQFSEIDVAEQEYPYDVDTAGQPRQYRIAEGTDNAKILRLKPPADGAYTIVVTYIQEPLVLNDDADEADFVPGTSDWVVYDVAMKMLEMDADGSQAQAFAARRNRAEGILTKYAQRQHRAGPIIWNSVKG